MKVCCTNEQEGRLMRTGRKGPAAITQELLLMRGLCGPAEGRLGFHDDTKEDMPRCRKLSSTDFFKNRNNCLPRSNQKPYLARSPEGATERYGRLDVVFFSSG